MRAGCPIYDLWGRKVHRFFFQNLYTPYLGPAGPEYRVPGKKFVVYDPPKMALFWGGEEATKKESFWGPNEVGGQKLKIFKSDLKCFILLQNIFVPPLGTLEPKYRVPE